MSLSLQQSKVVAFEFSADKLELLKNTVCKGATDDELQLFMHVCNRTALDPFRNQIYAIKRAGKMTIQTGIDGFRLIAERTGKYSPGREPCYTYDVQGKLKSATSYIKKQTTDGSWHDISATAFWDEYVQAYNGKPSQFWAKMPHTMLSKVAEALALRKAFPADFSGLYTAEEMAQADNDNVEVLATPQHKQMEEVQLDLTEKEVDEFVAFNFHGQEENFKRYMNEIKERKEWSFRQCIDMFKKHQEHTSKSFIEWLSKSA